MNNYRQESIKAYYSTHYKSYMPQTVEGWNWVLDRIELNFGNIFSSIPKNSLILDVACGVGYLEHYLLKKGFTTIHAVDLSEEQIDVAKEKLREYGLDYNDKVRLEVVDVFEHLRKANKYDVIVMLDILDHLTKDKVIELLHLAHGTIRNGGFLILRVTNADNPTFPHFFYRDFTHETPFTLSSIQQCLSLTGFKVLRVNYEKIPEVKSRLRAIKQLKRFIHILGLKLLGKFLGISPAAFSEDLVAVGTTS